MLCRSGGSSDCQGNRVSSDFSEIAVSALAIRGRNMTVWVLMIWLNLQGVSFPAQAYTSEAACTAAGRQGVRAGRIGADETFICQPVPFVAVAGAR
jgi:hypothetical protein